MIRSTREAYGAPKGGRDMKGAGGFRYYLSRAENGATDVACWGAGEGRRSRLWLGVSF